jgi:hypothetical protein
MNVLSIRIAKNGWKRLSRVVRDQKGEWSKMADDTLVLPSSAELEDELEEVEAELDDLRFSANWHWGYIQSTTSLGDW